MAFALIDGLKKIKTLQSLAEIVLALDIPVIRCVAGEISNTMAPYSESNKEITTALFSTSKRWIP